MDEAPQPTHLSRDLVVALHARAASLGRDEMLVVPMEIRDGEAYYADDDRQAVRLAREAGLTADYLLAKDDRRYLQEFSAGWLLNLGIGISQDLSASAVSALIKYIWLRVHSIVERGLHAGPVAEVPTKVTIGCIETKSDGSIRIKDFEMEGPAQAVVATVARLLARSTGDQLDSTNGAERPDV